MTILFLTLGSAVLFMNASAQTDKTKKKDTTSKQNKTRIVGQDSMSKKNSDRDQNRKRPHKKSTNDEKTEKK